MSEEPPEGSALGTAKENSTRNTQTNKINLMALASLAALVRFKQPNHQGSCLWQHCKCDPQVLHMDLEETGDKDQARKRNTRRQGCRKMSSRLLLVLFKLTAFRHFIFAN